MRSYPLGDDEYEGTSHLLADGVVAPKLRVRIVKPQACER